MVGPRMPASPVVESPRPIPTFTGMGAIPQKRGVGFRVWAPHATGCSVVGSFNNWDAAAHPLVAEANGHWAATVDEAKVGDEYRFILRNGETELSRIDPWARKVTNSIGNGVIWQPPPPAAEPRFKAPTLDALVIYELHIGSFHTAAGQPGTFASAIEKLPYLRDLGINAVEVMPVAEFAGDFSWGYNPAHPFAVESAYGGPEGLLAFVRAAHDHGIAVILDVVYNHFGPSDLSLWQFDGWHENGQGGIYFYNDWRANTPWADTRPDFGRAEVRAYIHDNALGWLRDYGIDGLRFDMSVYIRTFKGKHGDPHDDLKEGWSLMQWINESVHREFPGTITIAEDLQNVEWMVKPAGAGGAGFDTQWDAAFVHPVRAAVIVSEDEQRNLDAVVAALRNRYDGDAFKRVAYSESHDEVANGKARLPTEIAPAAADSFVAKKRSVLGAALALTAPAIPMLFQGQEFLEDEWFRDEVPLHWDKLENFNGIQQLYRDLIALRRNLGGHSAGLSGQHLEVNHVDHDRKIIAYRRWREGGPGDDVMVVVNLSHLPVSDYVVGVPTGGTWRVRLNSDGRAYAPEFTDHVAFDAEAVAEPADGYSHRILAGLGAYSFVILSQDRGEARS
jgi:1,4-alpha-glucan branching enzyme